MYFFSNAWLFSHVHRWASLRGLIALARGDLKAAEREARRLIRDRRVMSVGFGLLVLSGIEAARGRRAGGLSG